MKFSKIAAAAMATALSVSATAYAQEGVPAGASVDLTVGTTVYGPEGNEVGTISQAANGAVVIDTGSNQATLGANSFVQGQNGPVIGMTKAQLDAAVEAAAQKAAAALDAALVVGADVRTRDGITFGTVDTIDADRVVIAREAGPLTLTRDQFGTDDNGLIILATMAQLQAALGQTAGGQ